MAQDLPDINGEYTIDTLIVESQQFPGVFDTTIVYKKIKVVHKELVVIDTNFSPIVNRWQVGIEGAYAKSTSTSSLDYLESSRNRCKCNSLSQKNRAQYPYGVASKKH